MNRSLLTRIATGTLGLALFAFAAIGLNSGTAGACSGPGCQGPLTSPQGPVVQQPNLVINPASLPELVVSWKNASCNWYPEGGLRIIAKARVQNMTNNPAGTFVTRVSLDNVQIAGSPFTTQGPLYGGQEISIAIQATPGVHTLDAYVDSNHNVTEQKESNNYSYTTVTCPNK